MATSVTWPLHYQIQHLEEIRSLELDPLGSTGWSAFVVDMTGAQIRELDVIGWGDLDEQMGRPANMTVTLEKANTAQLADVVNALEWGYEVQVYRDSVLMLWAVPVQQATDSGSPVVSFSLIECVPWYLSRRRNKRGEELSDLLLNGSFESGKSHWTGAGTVVSTQAYDGTDSLEVTNNGGTTAQKIVVRQATTLVVSTKIQIDSGSWVGPNADGLWLEVYATPWTGFGGVDKYGAAYYTGTEPMDDWFTKSVVVDLPDGFWDVFVRLRGPDGTVWFDDVQADVMPRPRRTEWAGIFPPPDAPVADQGALLREALLSNIDGLELYVDVPNTGPPYMEDEPGAYADRYLSELADLIQQREDGMEWAGVYTPPTRGVKAWYPKNLRGTAHSSFVLTFGSENAPDGPNLASYSREVDQTRARTTTVVVGEGGFTGEASDEGTWNTKLEEIVRAPGATPIPDLEGVARENLRSDPAKVTALSVVTHERANDLIGVLRLADTCVTYIDDGPSVSFSGTYQVVARKVNPRTDTMTLTLNQVA